MTDARPPRRRIPKPDIEALTADLEAVTSRLDKLPAVISILTDAADVGYPSQTSGSDGSRGSSDLTQPERLAAHPDRDAQRAKTQLLAIAELQNALRLVARIVDGNARDRAVKLCPGCGQPWDDEWYSCRWQLPSGGQCMHIPGEDDGPDRCGNCRTKLVTGQRVRSSSDDMERCRPCNSWLTKYDEERPPRLHDTGATAGVARLELGTGSDVIADEVTA